MKITEIKKSARIKLTGNYIKCASSSLLYFTLVSVITFFQTTAVNSIQNSVILAIVQAILLLLNWIFSYGIIANILDLINVKTNSITDFINSTLKNCVKYTKIGLRILLKLLLPIALFIFSFFYWFGTMLAKINQVNFLCFYKNLVPLASFILILFFILLIYFIIKYTLVAYIYHENKDLDEKEIVEKSKNLMKGNLFNYILLLLSFLHWFLIGGLLLFLLSSFIKSEYLLPFEILFYSIFRPYFVTCKSEFYKELDDIKVEQIKPKDGSN